MPLELRNTWSIYAYATALASVCRGALPRRPFAFQLGVYLPLDGRHSADGSIGSSCKPRVVANTIGVVFPVAFHCIVAGIAVL